MVRRSFTLIGMALALVAGVAGASAPTVSEHRDGDPPARVELPDGFQPEGIALGAGPTAWFGSLADGDIYEVDLTTGEGAVIAEGPGTPSVGMKADPRGRLFVAGGSGGDARVLDVDTGEVLAAYEFADAATFVNDVVLTRHAAWFTDSLNAVLYGVPLGRGGVPGDPDDLIRLPLTGDWQQTEGFNANGIARAPDRCALLVVQSSTGLLFRVDPRTGVAEEVDLGGVALTNGDGLLTVGHTLYVVQNQLNQVAKFALNGKGTEGELVDYLASGDFDVPTTVAALREWLYLPNARFGTTPTPETAYWVTRIER